MAEPVTDRWVYDAALGVLARRGYAGATTKAIAAAAGVNEVTLFRRYGDKRSLILAAIHADVSRLAADGLSVSGDLEADLTRVVEYYAGLFRHRDGLVGMLVLEAARDAEVAAIIGEPLAAMSGIGDLLDHYRRTGELDDEPSDYAVQALVAPLLMLTIHRRISGGDGPIPEPAEVVRRFLDGRRPA